MTHSSVAPSDPAPDPWLDVFVAHGQADRKAAVDLARRLAPQCRTFVDADLPVGVEWDVALDRHLRSSSIVVVLMSRSGLGSHYLREEVAIAIGMCRQDPERHRIVPVFLEPVDVIPYGLNLLTPIRLEPGRTGLGDVADLVMASLRDLRHPPVAGPSETAARSIRFIDALDRVRRSLPPQQDEGELGRVLAEAVGAAAAERGATDPREVDPEAVRRHVAATLGDQAVRPFASGIEEAIVAALRIEEGAPRPAPCRSTDLVPYDAPEAAPEHSAARYCALPTLHRDLIGRDDDIADLVDVLRPASRSGPGRAVAWISGQPGIGKSAMAITAAGRLAAELGIRAWYIDMAGLDADRRRTPREAAHRLADALGLDISEASDDPVGDLWAGAAREAAVLVLDDVEDEAHLGGLTSPPPGWIVLVSSRTRDQTVADPRLLAHLQPIARPSSIELLDTYVPAHPLFDAIADLCADVPLALALVGARLASRPEIGPEAVHRLLADEVTRLDHLAAGQRSIRAAIRLSYDALDEPTRRILRLATAMIDRTLTPGVVSTILGETAARAEALLHSLVDSSLADARDLTGPDLEVRTTFRLPDLVHLFAAERRATEEDPMVVREVRRRALGVMIEHLADGDDGFGTAPATIETAIRIADAEGWRDLVTSLAELAFAPLVAAQDVERLAVLREIRILHLLAAADAPAAVTLALAHGDTLLDTLERPGAAVEAYSAAYAAADVGDLDLGKAHALHRRGTVHASHDRPEQATADWAEAAELFETRGHPDLAARTLINLSRLTADHQYEDRIRWTMGAAGLAREEYLIGSAHHELGLALSDIGATHEAALAHHRAALAWRDGSSPYNEAVALECVASLPGGLRTVGLDLVDVLTRVAELWVVAAQPLRQVRSEMGLAFALVEDDPDGALRAVGRARDAAIQGQAAEELISELDHRLHLLRVAIRAEPGDEDLWRRVRQEQFVPDPRRAGSELVRLWAVTPLSTPIPLEEPDRWFHEVDALDIAELRPGVLGGDV